MSLYMKLNNPVSFLVYHISKYCTAQYKLGYTAPSRLKGCHILQFSV